jgi:hypothetical protein
MSRYARTFILALTLAACGGGKGGPATQSTAAFDPKGSDEKSLAIATDVIAATGGEANWAKAKEIVWTQIVVVDGIATNIVQHSWDRWNARHQYIAYDAEGNEGKTSHDLFGEYAFAYRGKTEAIKAELPAMVKEASTRFYMDSYPFVLPFKLKDPGVHLKYVEERPEEGSAQGSPMKYDVIKVTFDGNVGPTSGDAYYVVVDKATHLPSIVEKVAAGKADDVRTGHRLSEWKDAGGLKFATRRLTLGYGEEKGETILPVVRPPWRKVVDGALPPVPKKSEVVYVTKITVNAEPDDILYVKPVAPDRL